MSSNLQEPTQIASRQSNHLKWTTEMNNTLLDCKAKAQALTNSQNPPRKENGRKKGYMAIMKELWENCGYAELNIPDSTNHNDQQSITNLKDGEIYRFLGILENTQQEDSKVLETTSKTYQQRLSVIWSSPLSDFHKVTATNQYALPALSYPMWTQTWQINALKQIDRESRKIIKDNGGSHPATSTDLYYLPRKMGGRGLKSVETQYKMTKVKTAVKLYTNQDSTMELVRQFDEKCERNGRRSIVKDAKKYAEEMGLELSLSPGAVVTTTDSNEDISSEKVGKVMQNSMNAKRIDTIKDQKWQGKLIQTRWIDTDLVDCFSCLYRWQLAPTNTIAGLFELYQQLVPTKLYNQNKTRTDTTSDAMCLLCLLCGISLPQISQTHPMSRTIQEWPPNRTNYVT